MKKFYIIGALLVAMFLGIGIYFLANRSNGSAPPPQDQPPSIEEEYYLNIGYTEINITLNETANITYSILPSNLKPTVSILNSEIISISNFVITPAKVGSTTVTLSHPNTDITKTFTVNILNPEINSNFNTSNFYSGKNNDEYNLYTLTVTTNFKITDKNLNYSNNISILDTTTNNNELIIQFNLLSGSSFTFELTLNGITKTIENSCTEYNSTPPTIPPDDPADPPQEEPTDPPADPPVVNPPENTYSYEFKINDIKIENNYTIKIDSFPKEIVITFKVFNNDVEAEFNSNVTILDANSVTKDSLFIGHKLVTILVFEAGNITLNFSSNLYDLTESLTLIFE